MGLHLDLLGPPPTVLAQAADTPDCSPMGGAASQASLLREGLDDADKARIASKLQVSRSL